MAATDPPREQVERREPISEAAASLPAPPLRPFIARYNGYKQAGVPPARHAGLPSPYLTVIFTLDEPLTIEAHPDPGYPTRPEFASLLCAGIIGYHALQRAELPPRSRLGLYGFGGSAASTAPPCSFLSVP